MKEHAQVLMAMILAVFSQGATADTYFVAPGGNDADPGSEAKPFATLARARDEMRKLKQAGPLKEAVTVNVRAGIHALPDGLQLEAQDGGTAVAPVTYRAYQNEKPILAGGRVITGFTRYKGEILKAGVAAQGLKGIYFRQLIFDGTRQILARYPNYDPKNPYGGGYACVEGKPDDDGNATIPGATRNSFICQPRDLRAWAHPEDAEVFIFPGPNYWNNILTVNHVDPTTRRIKLNGSASYPIKPGDRYYFQNALEELDAPGEWYLDRRTWTLYFWPPAPLEGKTVMAPSTRTILEIGPGAAYLTIRGLTFECSEGTAVLLHDTTNCLVAGCTIRNAGGFDGAGVEINGGTKNGVAGCDIHDTGSSGISIHGGDRIKLTAAGNYADNNYIHHVGVFNKNGQGVDLGGAGNRVSHNLIHDTPRMGIQFFGNNLLIEYNIIRHANLETADTGGIYTGGRDWMGARGSVIRYNYIHDMLGFAREGGRYVSPAMSGGIYLDDNTGGVDVIGNIVVRAPGGTVQLHNTLDTHIENNIFVDAKDEQIMIHGWTATHRYFVSHKNEIQRGYASVMNEPAWKNMRGIVRGKKEFSHPDGSNMEGDLIAHNIFSYSSRGAYYTNPELFPFEYNKFDYNLVWHQGQPILTGQKIVKKVLSENLAPNPGFEEGTVGQLAAGWGWRIKTKPDAKAEVDESAPASGRRALRIDSAWLGNSVHDNMPIISSQPIQLKAGHTYRLGAKFKSTKLGAHGSLMLVSNNGWWTEKPSEIDYLPTEYKEFSGIFKVPEPGDRRSNGGAGNFQIYIGYRGDAGSMFVDDVTLTEVEAADEWVSWQANGMDVHSVIADPLFVDAAKDDYRLKPESPAFKLGFKPILFESIGPYQDPLRASWPIVEAEGAREKPFVAGH
jgi:hypothetical protein